MMFHIVVIISYIMAVMAGGRYTDIGRNSTSKASSTVDCGITQYILALEDDCGFESIHGLWPDPEETCEYCTDEPFDESKLTSETLELMNEYWPTCYDDSTNEEFWTHEWEKHGTCTGKFGKLLYNGIYLFYAD